MDNKYEDTIDKLKKYNQNELVELITTKFSEDEKNKIIDQIERLNIEQVINLYNNAKKVPDIDEGSVTHIEYTDLNALDDASFQNLKGLGEEVIKKGEYAVITMAGGQGTRLGHKGPKGTFKIDTVNGEKYLFQIIVESLTKANKKYNITIPWYIMTSDENNSQTVNFLEEHNYFGYDKNKVTFFRQGKVPMIRDDGNLVVDKNKLIKEASDGNGSIYQSLKRANLIQKMKEEGTKWVFVGGVDNILLRIVDPILVGLTVKEGNLISSKSVVKKDPKERVGVFCKKNGVPGVIEYTELPEEMCEERDVSGELMYGEVNILSHLFNVEAIEKLAEVELPYHTAHKKSDYINANGELVESSEPNAYKFESFIFDGFCFFKDMTILRVNREDEFAPIKNKEGDSSPKTAVDLYNSYVERYKD